MSRSHSAAPLQGIDEMKFLFILGIVLMLSYDPLNNPGVGLTWWDELLRYISVSLCAGCVPCFLILSGYLFFYGIRRFDPVIYLHKLRRRALTLLVPYLFWNLVCLGILYGRYRWLGTEGYGVFLPDGSLDPLTCLSGFWGLPSMGYAPYAEAFWFVRNLMIFAIISPIARFLSRKWLVIALFLYMAFTGETFYGFIWFVAGAYMARESFGIGSVIAATNVWLMLPVMLLAAWLYGKYPATDGLIFILLCLSMLMTAAGLAGPVAGLAARNPLMRFMVSSAFFIFAFSQAIAAEMLRMWEIILDKLILYLPPDLPERLSVWLLPELLEKIPRDIQLDGEAVVNISAYVLNFLSLIVASIAVGALLKRLVPGLFSLISGGAGRNHKFLG